MKNIRVKFINFWPGFDPSSYIIYWNNIFNYKDITWTNLDTDKPDIVVTSVFGEIENIQKYNCKKILYTRENLFNYKNYNNNLSLFDLVIGFKDNKNQINIPYWYRLIKEYNDYPNQIYNNTNRKNICLLSRNPDNLRLSLIHSFNFLNYKIDCPGLVGNNMIKNLPTRESKINFISNYFFNICPENSYADGYTTEKLFDCCVAGCVPIYYGCERLNDGFYNKNRILHISQDLSNYDQIIDKTIYLLNHKNELIEFMNQNPFTIDYKNYIENIKLRIHNSLESLLLN